VTTSSSTSRVSCSTSRTSLASAAAVKSPLRCWLYYDSSSCGRV
jgi:hypothetical protein